MPFKSSIYSIIFDLILWFFFFLAGVAFSFSWSYLLKDSYNTENVVLFSVSYLVLLTAFDWIVIKLRKFLAFGVPLHPFVIGILWASGIVLAIFIGIWDLNVATETAPVEVFQNSTYMSTDSFVFKSAEVPVDCPDEIATCYEQPQRAKRKLIEITW